MRPSAITLIVLLAASAARVPALASNSMGGTPATRSAAADPLQPVRALVAARQIQAALAELQGVNATGNPDWNNLMGYCSRMSSPPDLVAAERYYAAALALDPKHLDTLEYLGEMRLQQGNLAGAEAELAALKRATFFKSEQFHDLQAAIARFKAAGGRYLPGDGAVGSQAVTMPRTW